MNSTTNNMMDYLFRPRSMAVIGVSPDLKRNNVGRMFLDGLVNQGYCGRLYAVGLDGGKYKDFKIYENIRDIPEGIDLAMVAIPAKHTIRFIKDAAARNVKFLHFYTAGFSELGEEHRSRLENELVAAARQHGIRILGPNCMGIYYPAAGLTFNPFFTSKSGTFGFVSQSGGHAIYASSMAERRGVYFSKAISYGNAADLNESDFLEYLAEDSETDVIALYIEGVADGHRFMQVLKHVSAKKPLLVFKGGISDIGRNATLSHTASIAGSEIVWDSAIRQAGAIRVHDVDEMMDMAALFSYTAPSTGKNTAIIGIGGGNSVLVADTWGAAGLAAPPLSPATRQQLKQELGREDGSSFRNPLDIFAWFTLEPLHRVIDILAAQPHINYVLIHLPVGLINMESDALVMTATNAMMSLPPEIKKRLLAVLYLPITKADYDLILDREKVLTAAGIPVFRSVERAAKALNRFVEYHRREEQVIS